MLLVFSVYASLLQLAAAAIWDNVEDLKRLDMSFDFIVVGGGTAGSVVANRLSENPQHSVLVLEAGGSNAGVLTLEAPLFCPLAVPFTAHDWNYTTTPQAGLNDRVLPYPRGFGLGGSSSVNYMVYTRGSKEDWDRFALVAEDARWSWDGLAPYMRKSEIFTTPADGHDPSRQFNATVHGFDGLNSVSMSGLPTKINSKIMDSTTDHEGEFPFNLDTNSGSPIGIGWTQMTSLIGARSSSATAYLAPKFVNRPNLQVLLHAQVSRILPTPTNEFRAVEFRDTAGWVSNFRQYSSLTRSIGHITSFTAKKEVILSAGSVGTPSILMHSGIGDSNVLRQLGIETRHNHPGVGKNLSDHAFLPLAWELDPATTDTFDAIFQNATARETAIAEWRATRTGRLTQNVATHMGWFRLPQRISDILFRDTPDPAAGPTTPHYELLFSNGFVGPTPATGKFFTISVSAVSPSSRGTISLASADPFAAPLIDLNLVGTQVDLVVMREAIRSALRFATNPAFKGYISGPPMGLSSTTPTDAELDALIKANSVPIFHAAGTASVSPFGAKWGVLDPNLRVKGVEGLRVVDVSVLPYIVSAHTQMAAYLVGERGADMIKEDHDEGDDIGLQIAAASNKQRVFEL
ncbi:Alcohol oxidase [Mycena kentingensis (nom. inval.)]|nr:Alcohol oxidase [Mycena kentingensis (nom. inval.)]